MTAKSRLTLDVLLFASLLAAFNPHLTGISVHEWLSLAIVVPLLFHLVINWDWVVHTASRIFKRIRATSGLNLVVDTLLFISAITVMMSGFLISQVISAALGITLTADAIWYAIHSWSADATIILLAVHLALHASWIARTVHVHGKQPRPAEVQGCR